MSLSEESKRKCQRCPTQRAADGGYAARFFSFFVALGFSRLDGESTLPPTAGNASRWAAEFGYNHAFEVCLLSKR